MNPDLQSLIDQVNATKSVEDSVLAYVTGVPALIDAKVAAAIANGATAAQLAPLSGLASELKTKTDAITAAIAANTPVTPVQFKAKK